MKNKLFNNNSIFSSHYEKIWILIKKNPIKSTLIILCMLCITLIIYIFSYCLVIPVIERCIHERDITSPTRIERILYLLYEPVEMIRNKSRFMWLVTEDGYKYFGGRRKPKDRMYSIGKRRDLIYRNNKIVAEVVWWKKGVHDEVFQITKWYKNGGIASIQCFEKNFLHKTIWWDKNGNKIAEGVYKRNGFHSHFTFNYGEPLMSDDIGKPFEGSFCEYNNEREEFIITKRYQFKLLEAKTLSGKIIKTDRFSRFSSEPPSITEPVLEH